ncbi:MAG TPA: hypothetical protein VFS16_01580, partial [Acidimicrobiia bacterium]|nr:hypothetical protein [Acidimicrobiia bacterium]
MTNTSTGPSPRAQIGAFPRVPRHRRPLVRLLAAVVGTALLAALPVVTPRPLAADALTPAPPGYLLVGGDGSVHPFGSARD